jgi:hypothetical protein
VLEHHERRPENELPMGKVFNKTLKLAQSAVFVCRRVEMPLSISACASPAIAPIPQLFQSRLTVSKLNS